MTSTGITSRTKLTSYRIFLPAHLDGDGYGLVGQGEFELPGAIARRPHQALWRYLDELGRREHLGKARHIHAVAGLQHGGQYHLAIVEGVFQIDGFGEDFEPDDLGVGRQFFLGGTTAAVVSRAASVRAAMRTRVQKGRRFMRLALAWLLGEREFSRL